MEDLTISRHSWENARVGELVRRRNGYLKRIERGSLRPLHSSCWEYYAEVRNPLLRTANTFGIHLSSVIEGRFTLVGGICKPFPTAVTECAMSAGTYSMLLAAFSES